MNNHDWPFVAPLDLLAKSNATRALTLGDTETPDFDPFSLLGLPFRTVPPSLELLASTKRAAFRRLVQAGQMSAERSVRINVAYDFLADNLEPRHWRDIVRWARSLSPSR